MVLRKQAEHMDAPDRCLSPKKSLVPQGGIHTITSGRLHKKQAISRKERHIPEPLPGSNLHIKFYLAKKI